MIEDLLASDPEILELFQEELSSHCEALELAALSYQSGGGRSEGSSESLRDLFRRLHTIKGSAYSVGFTEVGRLAHRVEDLVRSLLDSEDPPPALFGQVLLRVVDELRRLGRDSALNLPAAFWGDLDQVESRILGGTAAESAPGESAAVASDSSRESVESSLAVTEQVMVPIEALDELTLELERLRSQFERPDGDPGAQAGRAERIGRELLSIRQVPFGRLEGRLRRVVFDAASELGKSVRFEILGREIRIDAGLLDDLAVMLPHLLRNSLDHGLESVSQRIAAGKDPEGSLTLACEMRQGEVRVVVEDDGRGIDGVAVLRRAVERGVISAERAQELTHYERERLIFAPGFSTREESSRFSGRGMGLDIVERLVQSRQGEIDLRSRLGEGTRFELKFAQRFVWESLLVVRVAERLLGLPLSIVKSIVLRRDAPPVRDGAVLLDGVERAVLSFEDLGGVIRESEIKDLVVLELGGMPLALPVDGLLDFTESLVQSLPDEETESVVRGFVRWKNEPLWVLSVEDLSANWNAYTAPL